MYNFELFGGNENPKHHYGRIIFLYVSTSLKHTRFCLNPDAAKKSYLSNYDKICFSTILEAPYLALIVLITYYP